MMDQFRDWANERHAYAKEWKERTGGRVVGYFCTYAPEEIMCAAGLLPVRILGSHEPQDVIGPSSPTRKASCEKIYFTGSCISAASLMAGFI